MQPRMSKRWVVKEQITPEVREELAAYPTFFQQILFARGITTADQAKAYIDCSLSSVTDPLTMKGMAEAVACLMDAIDRDIPIAVYGDYDVDGVTATALMTLVLRQFGAQAIPYIPNRFDEGYGLNVEAIKKLADDGIKLIVTVDCGIRSPAEARLAQELGVQMVISDHHHPAEELPAACAVICPKQEGCEYAEKDLSGVGLAYKIAQALVNARPNAGVCAEDYLDLVALGTVADVVPLVGENRVLVRQGLARMRARMIHDRPGLLALANVARVNALSVTATDVAFMLGPRLNASGRLETAMRSLELLMATDRGLAGVWAQELDDQNRKRQEMTRKTQEAAAVKAQAGDGGAGGQDILFAFDETFNPGVVGLAASRLVEMYYRPAVVGVIENGVARASCRSIPEFHITEALDGCRHLMERHGGHALAAGFTIKTENLPQLIDCLREAARNKLAGQDLRPMLRADAEVRLEELRHPDFMRYLDMLQPTGQGNSEALFVSRNVKVLDVRYMGAEKQHAKLKVEVPGGRGVLDVVCFRQAEKAAALKRGEPIDVMYHYERNEFNGIVTPQMNARDFKPSGMAD